MHKGQNDLIQVRCDRVFQELKSKQNEGKKPIDSAEKAVPEKQVASSNGQARGHWPNAPNSSRSKDALHESFKFGTAGPASDMFNNASLPSSSSEAHGTQVSTLFSPFLLRTTPVHALETLTVPPLSSQGQKSAAACTTPRGAPLLSQVPKSTDACTTPRGTLLSSQGKKSAACCKTTACPPLSSQGQKSTDACTTPRDAPLSSQGQKSTDACTTPRGAPLSSQGQKSTDACTTPRGAPLSSQAPASALTGGDGENEAGRVFDGNNENNDMFKCLQKGSTDPIDIDW
jgi:hypothetical protein